MDELKGVLKLHQERYPKAEALDLVKLVYQNEFGAGHFITDEEASLARLKQELSSSVSDARPEELFESIGGGLMRLHLRALDGDLSAWLVNRFFTLTANEKRGSIQGFEEKLSVLRELSGSAELNAYLEEYKAAGYPPVSHSPQYKAEYAPSYRVVKREFALFYPVFREIERLLQLREQVVVAIDGRSGSGKSFFAGLLQGVYSCPVIAMDHFFLQPHQRTAARFQEPGGNVDYERFQEEVAIKLKTGESFQYRIYNCQDGSFTSSPLIEPHRLVVVEGCYSHHPTLVERYDLKVFLTVPPQVQRERILERSGPVLLERFLSEWIPLEELFFIGLKIQEQSDLVIDTSK